MGEAHLWRAASARGLSVNRGEPGVGGIVVLCIVWAKVNDEVERAAMGSSR